MILIRHILRAHIGPFLFSFVTLMFIFLLQFLMKYIDQIAGKGLSWLVIIEFISLSLAWMIVLAVPMSVLVSTLMAFGMLSSNNEITALKSAGVSVYRIMTPVIIAAAFLTYFLIWFNNDVLPDANHRWATLFRDIQRKKPTLTLEAGVFSKDIQDYCILVRKTFEHSNELDYMTIYDYKNTSKSTVITARKGNIGFSSDYSKVVIDLFDGEIHETSGQNFRDYRKINFSKHRILIVEDQYSFKRSGESAFSRGDRELSSKAMKNIVDSLKKIKEHTYTEVKENVSKQFEGLMAGKLMDSIVNIRGTEAYINMSTSDRALSFFRMYYSQIFSSLTRIQANDHSMDSYLVEIYKKYSIPVACIVFVLLGAPLGIMTKKGGFGVGASLSLGFFLLYWACLIGGEKLADRDIITPFLSMWIANFILFIFGVYLVYKVVRESTIINFEMFRVLVPKQFRSLEDQSKNS